MVSALVSRVPTFSPRCHSLRCLAFFLPHSLTTLPFPRSVQTSQKIAASAFPEQLRPAENFQTKGSRPYGGMALALMDDDDETICKTPPPIVEVCLVLRVRDGWLEGWNFISLAARSSQGEKSTRVRVRSGTKLL